MTLPAAEPFRVTDGERVIRFGAGALADAPALLSERSFDGYALLTTQRAREQAPAVVAAASATIDLPAGPVPEIAAGARGDVGGRPLVALGGGRVVDAAKAIGGADGLPVAAIPTTLAGSAITAIHRMPAGVDGWNLIRPALVIADPDLSASAPRPQLLATAMNSLAHAMESLYGPMANPVAEGAALRSAELLAAALPLDPVARPQAALGGLLGGWAVGLGGISFHHAICQTIVRTLGTPHAETNATMLPRTAALAARLHPGPLGAFARALGDPVGDPAAVPGLITALAGEAALPSLADLGVAPAQHPDLIDAVVAHPVWPRTGLGPDDVAELLA